MARRRRINRRANRARCGTCRFGISWFRLGGHWRMFDPSPVNGRKHVGHAAFPVTGKHAHRREALVEQLMAAREMTRAEAEAEVYDMPWFVLHACPPDPALRKEPTA